jgi:hypothetical protein
VSKLKLVIFFLLFCVLSGCLLTSKTQESDKKFVGLSVSYVIKNLSLKIDDGFVITEPPAVPRGIRGTSSNGDLIHLFILRGQLPLTFEDGDNLALYKDLKVIGIKREHAENSTCYGEVIWQLNC